MIKRVEKPKLHWNYFLALESDLATVSRYVEFSEANMGVYSIELAHLLFAAASEVDVLAKCICKAVLPESKPDNINDYRKILTDPAHKSVGVNSIAEIKVTVPRYGLEFAPWDNWQKGVNPDWWKSYNNVKHQRDQHFNEATLKNALDAMGALLIMNLFYYRFELFEDRTTSISPKGVLMFLLPESTLLKFEPKLYGLSAWLAGQSGLHF